MTGDVGYVRGCMGMQVSNRCGVCEEVCRAHARGRGAHSIVGTVACDISPVAGYDHRALSLLTNLPVHY